MRELVQLQDVQVSIRCESELRGRAAWVRVGTHEPSRSPVCMRCSQEWRVRLGNPALMLLRA